MAKIPPELQRKWKQRLADSGFEDIEDSKGNLKQPNQRTAGFETRDCTLEFYQLLAHYLQTAELTRLERRILELHSKGIPANPKIALEVFRSESYVRDVIHRHRKIILHRK